MIVDLEVDSISLRVGGVAAQTLRASATIRAGSWAEVRVGVIPAHKGAISIHGINVEVFGLQWDVDVDERVNRVSVCNPLPRLELCTDVQRIPWIRVGMGSDGDHRIAADLLDGEIRVLPISFENTGCDAVSWFSVMNEPSISDAFMDARRRDVVTWEAENVGGNRVRILFRLHASMHTDHVGIRLQYKGNSPLTRYVRMSFDLNVHAGLDVRGQGCLPNVCNHSMRSRIVLVGNPISKPFVISAGERSYQLPCHSTLRVTVPIGTNSLKWSTEHGASGEAIVIDPAL